MLCQIKIGCILFKIKFVYIGKGTNKVKNKKERFLSLFKEYESKIYNFKIVSITVMAEKD
ncbi:MAG: hypothetical protein A2889_01390 [Nitrospinae bacterium RIFCSPLOWO2_01_FULL_39_10]|nr:MAG: hypothetical protein A2889_01390 [Nitrospinae bacterium RIFCSPLOWO2_01_FULL_39_10]